MKDKQSPAGSASVAGSAIPATSALPRKHATLRDGSIITVRDLVTDDFAAVMALTKNLSGKELYLRFFTFYPKHLVEWAHSVTEPPPGSVALGAFDGQSLLAVGNYVPTADPGTAEIGIVVAHSNHYRGIATVLLTHLGEHAKNTGTQRLIADVLVQNLDMRRVISDAGWSCHQHRDGEVISVEIDLTNSQSPNAYAMR
jgi:RimJ/RimL family protein N-acetyltransferase